MPRHPQTIVVTGAAGSIGRPTCLALVESGHHVRGVDRVDPGTAPPHVADAIGRLSDYRQCDITDEAALVDAFDGADCVIHLAANPGSDDFMNDLLDPNIIGAYAAFAAVAKAGVRRMMPVSSSQVVFGHEHENHLITADMPFAPPNHYAVSKVFMESLAWMYAKRHDIEMLIVRPGWLPNNSDTLASIGLTKRKRGLYLSHDDAGRFFVKAVASDAIKPGDCHVVYVQSRCDDDSVGMDRTAARELVGYEPVDLYPQGCPTLEMPELA